MGQLMERNTIIQRVKSAGVVGAGGAGFPTHVKLAGWADTVIANGAECEPLLAVDKALLAEHPEEVLAGLQAAKTAVGASKVIVALKAKHKRLTAAWERKAAIYAWLQIIGLPDVYPIGDEHVLVHELLARTIPPGGIPPDVGAVVLNIETLYNIGRAMDGIPVTHSFVTVTGAVASAKTMAVPVGTAVCDVLKLVQPLHGPGDFAVVEGGPMMGRLLLDLKEPITKTTKGLIVLPKTHQVISNFHSKSEAFKHQFSVCSQCTMCTDLCPRHQLNHPIAPHRIMRALIGGEEVVNAFKSSEVLQGALFCSECGICDMFACFMGLSPRTVNQFLKAKWTGLRPESKPDCRRPVFGGNLIPTARLLHRLGLSNWESPTALMPYTAAPSSVRIKLKQQIGLPAHPVVAEGDQVSFGEIIGKVSAEGLGACVHASIGGVAVSVQNDEILIRRWDHDT
ncbi:MAG: electron transport complex protein RnfC [Firmicutes bacterium]|nr:electron transport complex protein RnfC [Bacillota bacterium]